VRFLIQALTATLLAQPLAAQEPWADEPFTIYVSSESGDVVTRIEVGPSGWRKGREIPVGVIGTGIDGPHGVSVAPDGRSWYVSLAHGAPLGSVWGFATDSDAPLGRVQVGMFPTTVGISPDGSWAVVPNSDFHGDRGRLNTLSVLYLPGFVQVREIPTCDMPHGSRFNGRGSAAYIACMMSDELVELDASALEISRRVSVGPGGEHAHGAAAIDRPGAASSTLPGQDPACLPTYVSVSPDDRLVYLACNHANELQVRDAASLELERRLVTGDGPYNVEPSPDGRWVLVTNRRAQSVSVFDTRTWSEVARVPTSKPVPHGIVFSPDGRYALVSVESVGSDPGAVDAIALGAFAVVASMPIPRQPTGIAIARAPSSNEQAR
jgi:YVTN family beta-propeller protein